MRSGIKFQVHTCSLSSTATSCLSTSPHPCTRLSLIPKGQTTQCADVYTSVTNVNSSTTASLGGTSACWDHCTGSGEPTGHDQLVESHRHGQGQQAASRTNNSGMYTSIQRPRAILCAAYLSSDLDVKPGLRPKSSYESNIVDK